MKKTTIFLAISIVAFLFLALPTFAMQATGAEIEARQQEKVADEQNADHNVKPTSNEEDVALSDAADDTSAEDVYPENEEFYAVESGDSLEDFNRSMFSFNEWLDKYILKPVAKFYNLIMPRPLNEGVHNFFNNLDTVPTIVNDILQLHFHQMANDMWRFGINSTIGIGGLFDIATRIKLQHYENDFGMTLARYGYQKSTYVVLPLWGPRTIRDTISLPVDYFLFSLYPHINPQELRFGLYGLSVIDWRAQVLKHKDLFEAVAVDKYSFVRNAYIQYRSSAIKNNERRSYADIKEDQTPIAVVDANEVQASDDGPTLEFAE